MFEERNGALKLGVFPLQLVMRSIGARLLREAFRTTAVWAPIPCVR